MASHSFKGKVSSELLIREPLLQKNGRMYFVQASLENESGDAAVRVDFIDKVKGLVKKYPRFYSFLIDVISPVYFHSKRSIKRSVLEACESGKVVLNIGSGAEAAVFDSRVINCDLFAYPGVDVVCDAHNLPFRDGSVDTVVNIAVLEHVQNPQGFVSEFHRVLKKNGEALVFVPFMQGFHASPHDYYRWTDKGCFELFSQAGFSDVRVEVAEGPTSGMLWVLQEWLSTVLSFGIPALHKMWYLVFLLLLWPIKYLDLLFRFYPTATHIAAGFYIRAKK